MVNPIPPCAAETQAARPPRLRADLILSAQDSPAGPVLVVKDPITRNFFRLRELEGFIARQLDGATPAATIRRRAEERFGAPLTGEALERFLSALRQASLLEDGARARSRAPHRRLAGSLLVWRFRIANPDRVLGVLARRIRFPWSAGFRAIAALSILAAAWIAIGHWGEVRSEFLHAYRPAAIPLILLVIFVVASLHEMAHGLTCKRSGGEVPEMGFMLMYFQPALYCNVSDAWLFPDRARRLAVGLAGPCFELFLWSVAVLAWRVTEPGTWFHHVAYLVMTTSGIKTLFNFNPLIKLDGYYLLSDCLEMPNLRPRAFLCVANAVRRLGGVAPAPEPADMTGRERRIALVYGVASLVFTLSLIGAVAVKLGGYLIEHGQPLGLALLGGIVTAKMRRRVRTLFRGRSAWSAWDDDLGPAQGRPASDRVEENDRREVRDRSEEGGRPAERSRPEARGAGAPPPGPARRRKRAPRRPRRRWVLAAAGALALALVAFGRLELKVRGPFHVAPVHNADVRAGIEGVIEVVRVREGDRVAPGDPIADLSARDLDLELRKVEADLEERGARLRLLEAGPTAEEVAAATAALSRAEQNLALARAKLAMDEALFEARLIARKDHLDSRNAAAVAESEVAEAKSGLALVRRGARPEEIEALRAETGGLEAERRYLEEQRRLLHVVSPVAGVVTTPTADLESLENRLVRKGDLIAEVYDFTTVAAEIAIAEHDIAAVRVGSEVQLKARSHPGRTFRGVVTAIATTTARPAGAGGATAASGTILVRTEIENDRLLLKPGMTGYAKISGGPRTILELVRGWFARRIRVEFWSWW